MKYIIELENTIIEGTSLLQIVRELVPYLGRNGLTRNLSLYFNTINRNIPISVQETANLEQQAKEYINYHIQDNSLLPFMEKAESLAYLAAVILEQLTDFANENPSKQICKLIKKHKAELIESTSDFLKQKREVAPYHAVNTQIFFNFIYELATKKQREAINVMDLPDFIAYTVQSGQISYCAYQNTKSTQKIAIYEGS